MQTRNEVITVIFIVIDLYILTIKQQIIDLERISNIDVAAPVKYSF